MSDDPVDDINNFELPKYFGSILVEFLTIEDAQRTKSALLTLSGT